MAAGIDRKALIDYLLQRRFGSVAPPSARAEYEAMSSAALQDAVLAEKTRKRQEQDAEVRAEREKSWPAWARKDLWSEVEFAALCCGLIPDECGLPGDPGKVTGIDSQAMDINRAMDDIRRGTLAGTLQFVPHDDTDAAVRVYGTARHFVPVLAAEWAAARFDTFPTSLLALVKQRGQAAAPATAATPVSPKQAPCKTLASRERNNLLRILRAVDLMNPNPLPLTGYAESIRAQLVQLGLNDVSDDTIRKVIEDARSLVS